jgi:DNA (cytosine-5)-methyltransferase 1
VDLHAPPQIVLEQALRRYSKTQLAKLLAVNPVTISRWQSGAVRMVARDSLAILALLHLQQPRIEQSSPGYGDQAQFGFIDLFAGIGGMRLGFEAVGGRCDFSCEWNGDSQRTYQENFPNDRHAIEGDIRSITQPTGHESMPESELLDRIRARVPKHDVLLAGFPCQPFSLAGVSKKNSLGRSHGFACEAQGTLFFDIAKILQARQPGAFLLENVKNLESHNKGQTFQVIVDVLRNQLGYEIYPHIIDAKGYVPQHRERIFIVGFKKHSGFSWDPLRAPSPSAKRLDAILHSEDGREAPEGHFTVGPKAKVSEKYWLSDKLWAYLQAYRAKHEKKGNGFGYSLFDRHGIARTLSARYHKDGSEILISRGKGRNPRRLTPRECARLMGFDYGARRFKIPESLSDTKAYQQFGNAVVVPVVEEVARLMRQPLLQLLDEERIGAGQASLL